jgi:hypothetical protein
METISWVLWPSFRMQSMQIRTRSCSQNASNFFECFRHWSEALVSKCFFGFWGEIFFVIFGDGAGLYSEVLSDMMSELSFRLIVKFYSARFFGKSE